MVKRSAVSVDIAIPAKALSPVTSESLGNVLADNPFHQGRIIVYGDGGLGDPESQRIRHIFGDAVDFITPSGASRGPAWARNRLAEHSRSDFIIFVDADVLLPPQFLSRILPELQNMPDGVVFAPRISPLSQRTVISRFFSTFTLGPSIVGGRVVVPTTVLAMSRNTWLAAGPFDERFVKPGGEDWDWMIRNNCRPTHEFTVRYAPHLSVPHRNPATPSGLLRRAWVYGSQTHWVSKERQGSLTHDETLMAPINGECARAESLKELFALVKHGGGKGLILWRNRVLVDVRPGDVAGFILLLILFRLTHRSSASFQKIFGGRGVSSNG